MFRLFVILSFCFIFLACESNNISELEIAKQKWRSSDIKNYRITESFSCECAGVMLWDLYVTNQVKDTVTYDDPFFDIGETYTEVLAKTQTIEDIFDFIDGLRGQDVYTLDIDFDQEYGFPKSIYIDYIKDAIDDEILYRYYNFEQIILE